MVPKHNEYKRAVELRTQGLSYNEIIKHVDVSKSTLSVWLKDLPLTVQEKEYLRTRLNKNITRGRIKAAAQNRANRLKREQKTYIRFKQQFEKYKMDPIFLLGIALYWAEGASKTPMFQFVNSDPVMVQFLYMWSQKYLGVPKERIGVRIYMHKCYSQSECERFWTKLLDLQSSQLKRTIFKPSAHTYKKKPSYHGCVRLEIGGVQYYRAMMAWKGCLKEYILPKHSKRS